MLAEPGPDRDQRAHRTILTLLLLFGVLVARLAYLQIGQHDLYRRAADENRIRATVRPAPRGIIRDRAGNILAENRATFAVEISTAISAARADTLAAVLARAGGMPRDELRERLEEAVSSRPERVGRRLYKSARVVHDARIPFVAFLEERAAQLPEVEVKTRAKRFYRFDDVACHAIGYLGEIRGDELKQAWARGRYDAGDLVGRSGVEENYEKLLSGTKGVRVIEVDARGRQIRILPGQENRDPEPGMELYLTLDIGLQELADSLLQAEGKAGACVVLDPRNGDVLALVSKPGYDLNLFGRGRISLADWEQIRDDPATPMLHRAIAGLYPPASTWKLLISALALEAGYIDETTVFPASCVGGYQFGRRFFRCWYAPGHGSTNLLGAFETSCDVYYYQLGQRFPLDQLSAGAEDLGFATRTGIDIRGEKKGQLPSTAYYNKRYGPNGWSRGVLLNLSIGQGEILVTPLQLAAFYGAMARGGLFVQPHILLQAAPADGLGQRILPTSSTRQLPVQAETLAMMERALLRVTEGEHGTGKAAEVPGVRVGAKTGTAENSHGDDHAWFAAVAPIEDPDIAVVLLVEEGGHGGATAAPLVGTLLRRHFGVLPTLAKGSTP